MTEKVVRNGLVAVLYSPNFGAGWSTWCSGSKEEVEILLFHPKIVAMVESDRRSEITSDWLQTNFNIDTYDGGAEDLTVCWLKEGTPFAVHEYDGSESIVTHTDLPHIA